MLKMLSGEWRIKNQQQLGFAVLPVLLVAGVVAMMAVAFAEFYQSSQRATLRVIAEGELNEMVAELSGSLNEPSICASGIGSGAQNFDLASASASGQEISFTSMQGVQFRAGAFFSDKNMTVDKLYLKAESGSDPGIDVVSGNQMYKLDLYIQTTTSKDVLGSKSFSPRKVSEMKMFVVPATKQMVSCMKDSGATAAQMCASLGGTYDAAIGLCRNLGGSGCGSYVHGETYTTACPVGQTGIQTFQCWNGEIRLYSSYCHMNCGSVIYGQTTTSACTGGKIGSETYRCLDGSMQLIGSTCRFP